MQSDNTVNGTGISTADGVQLYANMVEPLSGKVIGSVPVNADGTYSFNGVPAGTNLRIEISTNSVTALSNVPTKTLPPGWSNTGENVGAGAGSDGANNGAIAVPVTSNVSNVNLGIVKLALTAAFVNASGHIISDTGRGICSVKVTMIDSSGATRTTTSTAFGYYRFYDVTAGETYVFSVKGNVIIFISHHR